MERLGTGFDILHATASLRIAARRQQRVDFLTTHGPHSPLWIVVGHRDVNKLLDADGHVSRQFSSIAGYKG
jgi:hypothetical protein